MLKRITTTVLCELEMERLSSRIAKMHVVTNRPAKPSAQTTLSPIVTRNKTKTIEFHKEFPNGFYTTHNSLITVQNPINIYTKKA